MFEIGSSSHNSENLRCVQEINVMVVSNDKQLLVATTALLESFPYRVRTVDNAMMALSILSERMQEFDLVLVDINLNDLDVFTLLRLVGKMEFLAALMSEDEDDEILLKALANGAYMLVGRPLSVDRVKEIRQHVIRDRLQKRNKSNEQTNMLGEISTGESEKSKESKGKGSMRIDNGREARNKRKRENVLGKNTKRCKKYSNKDQECDSKSENNSTGSVGRLKKKVCTEWTEELHEKFMDAVNQLGEGKCYPKEILDLMNVPGLTRMQVASHLQKCRNDNWKAPEARKSSQYPGAITFPNDGSQKRNNQRKFGSMPRLDKNQPNGQESVLMSSSFDSELSGNGRRPQDFHPKGGLPSRFGSYPYRMSLGRQILGQRPGYVAYEGNQTMGSTNGDVEVNSNAYYNSSYTTAMERAEHSNYDTSFSDLGGAYLSGSIYQKQPHDDFVNYLREMDDYVPNMGRNPEGSRVNQTLVSQQFVYDSNQIFSDQQDANKDIEGEWSTDASFFHKP